MTEFEQQVADALRAGMDSPVRAHTGRDGVEEALKVLVPRAAAAFDAVLGLWRDTEVMRATTASEARRVFLAGLRGA